MAEKNLKVYYTIKDVAEIVGVTEPTLRFWETEFPHIKPETTANKVRQYTMKEIDDIKVIYNLIRVRGFKIAAAKKMLHTNRSGVDKTDKVLRKLQDIKSELLALKTQLDIIV
jgi:DNA-binding transcriptional MerR regulator